jgi:outer membrane protein TolC
MTPELLLVSTLTLRGAVDLALSRSPEVVAAARRAEEAGLEEPLLVANIDPRLEGGWSATDDQSPRAAPAFEGSRARLIKWDSGLAAKTLLGSQAKINFHNEKLLNPTPFRVMDPTVASRLSLELSQPLLRYFWGRPDLARRKRARAGTAAAAAQLKHVRESVAASAARAWLELRFARGQVGVKEAGVADARRLLEKYQDKRRYGLVEASDLLQAQASLEAQEIELALALSESERARTALQASLQLMDADIPRLGDSEALPDPKGEPDLSRRGDVAAAMAQRDLFDWASRIETLDTLPELTVHASYGMAGLGTRYDSSWRDLNTWDHSVRTAGFNVTVPLIFRKERLTRKAARLRASAARAEEERAKTQARKEWRDAAELLRLARRRAELHRALASLERKKFAAEEENFRRGRSSTDLLLRFQQDIRRAESSLLRAETDEAAARLEAARASGTLLEALATQ